MQMERLNTRLESDQLKKQITEWKSQEESLRQILKDVWNVRSESFEPFWKDESSKAKQIRVALVKTSMEDLANSFPNAQLFVPLTCPELIELEGFDVDKACQYTWTLMELLAESKENASERFDATGMSCALADAAVSQPTVAVDSLALIRSLLLLTFATNIFAVFSAEEDAALQADSGGG